MAQQEQRELKFPRQHFAKIARFSNPTMPLFIGPFDSKEELQDEIEAAKERGIEIVTDTEPQNPGIAVIVEQMGKIAAIKAGMQSPEFGGRKNNLRRSIPRVEDWTKIDTKISKEIESEKKLEGGEGMVAVQKPVVVEEIFDNHYHSKQDIVIVARYSGIVKWLNNKGIDGSIVNRVYHPEQIRGKIVIGVLPIWLACFAKKIGIIDMPNLSDDERGQQLTSEQIEKSNARIRWYNPPSEDTEFNL